MKTQLNTFVDKSILIAAFWSAVIVASVTFARDAWKSNNMTEKTRNAILWFMGVLDALVLYVRNELTPIEIVAQQGDDVPVAKVSTKRTKGT